MAQALDGIRVLDFSRVLAGPLATMMLGDFGAEIVKVERPGTGDETRHWGPPYDDAGEPTYFQAVNRNKRSVVLDLRDPEGVAAARRLAAESDVVVENFRPGVMARLGLDPERLRAQQPELIYCSISAFGTGAGARLPGYDLLVQAAGGLMSITGPPDGEPQKVGVALVDVLAGLFATVGILAALRHRERTGEGQLVEVDLLSSLLAALVNQSSAYTLAGVVAERMGNAHPSIAPYELFETASGDLVMGAGNERQFRALCEVLGAAALADDPRFSTNSARVANRDELRERIVALLAERPADEWAPLLTDAGVPAGAVNTIDHAFELADSLGLEPTVEIRRNGRPPVRLPRNPIRLSETPPTYRLPPPRLPD